MIKPMRRSPWVSRPMDGSWGDVAMSVERGGAILLAAIPAPYKPENPGGRDQGLAVWFKPKTTPPPVYDALRELYKAIKTDNKKLGGYGGAHA